MMKFFRKYNKQLLAVFMTLLMVVFLGGSALQGMLNPSNNRVVATSNLGDITLQDQITAQQTTGILNALGMDWRRPVGLAAETPIQEMHWILLLREARKFGMDTEPAMVHDWFQPGQLNNLSSQIKVRQDRILAAVADLNSIQQTALAIGGAASPSEAEVTAAARNALETVKIHAVVLPAEAAVDDSYEPDEAAIKEQFDKYRDKPAGKGLNFGYYREPTVQVQYIKIDRDAIAKEMTVPDLAKLARDYYEEHRASDPELRRPPEETKLPEGFEGPPADPYLSWEEARPIAEQAARRAQASAVAERMANRVLQYTSEVWFEAERGPDGYKDAPEQVQERGYYKELTARLGDFSDALSVATTGFFTRADASDVPELGQTAFRPERGTPERFATLISRSEAFVPEVPKDQGASSVDYYAMFQTCPFPLTDAETGDVYIFRPFASRAGRPAESVNEVRDEIVSDLRLLHAYETVKSRADALRDSMVSDPELSLNDAFEAQPELVKLATEAEGTAAGYVDPPPFSRVPKYQAAQGRPENGVYVGGIGLLSNDVVDQCFALADAPAKTSVIEVPDRATVMVVKWVETTPPNADEFKELREQLVTQLSMTRRFEALSSWLDPERIKARTGLELASR